MDGLMGGGAGSYLGGTGSCRGPLSPPGSSVVALQASEGEGTET